MLASPEDKGLWVRLLSRINVLGHMRALLPLHTQAESLVLAVLQGTEDARLIMHSRFGMG